MYCDKIVRMNDELQINHLILLHGNTRPYVSQIHGRQLTNLINETLLHPLDLSNPFTIDLNI